MRPSIIQPVPQLHITFVVNNTNVTSEVYFTDKMKSMIVIFAND